MNLEKFTDRAKGFLQSAQTVAIRMSHQRITPEHLLKALLEDSEGMAAQLIQRAGGNAKVAADAVVSVLEPLQRRYADLADDPAHVEEVFEEGSARCREVTAPVLAAAREAVGLIQPS